jgi:hypothetical protein
MVPDPLVIDPDNVAQNLFLGMLPHGGSFLQWVAWFFAKLRLPNRIGTATQSLVRKIQYVIRSNEQERDERDNG